MVVFNTFLIVLFSILLSHSAIGQDTSEFTSGDTTEETSVTSQTTIITETPSTTSCTYPDEFPLFSNDVCISRAAYTAIFLTSIILAGISFLMLIGLLILYCTRHSRSSDSTYDSDDESNRSNSSVGRKSIRTKPPPVNNTTVLQNMTGATPLEENIQKRSNPPLSNNHYMVTEKQVPPPSSSAPYTSTEPVAKQTTRVEQITTTQQRRVNRTPTESHEMVLRRTNQPPTTSPPKTAAKPAGRSGKLRANTAPPDADTETSYF